METLAGGNCPSFPCVDWVLLYEYYTCRVAKQLNSRQAWWALFLSFDYTVTYRPSSRFTNPMRFLVRGETSEESIIFLKCVVTAVRWEIEHSIEVVQHSEPSPSNYPPNRMFVPDSAKSPVLLWRHASKGGLAFRFPKNPLPHPTAVLVSNCLHPET